MKAYSGGKALKETVGFDYFVYAWNTKRSGPIVEATTHFSVTDRRGTMTIHVAWGTHEKHTDRALMVVESIDFPTLASIISMKSKNIVVTNDGVVIFAKDWFQASSELCFVPHQCEACSYHAESKIRATLNREGPSKVQVIE